MDIYCEHVPDRAARHRTNDRFVRYWTRRMSSATVMADARRCLKRLPGLEEQARRALCDRAARGAPE